MHALEHSHFPQQACVFHAQQRPSQSCHCFDRPETEHRHIRIRMPRVVRSCERLRAVFDHQDAVLLRQLDHRPHRHSRAKKVCYHDRARPLRDCRFDRSDLRRHGLAFDVQWNGNQSMVLHNVHHLRDGQRRHQDFAAGRERQRPKTQIEPRSNGER